MLLSELKFLDFEARLDSRSSRALTVRNTQVGSCIKRAVSEGSVVGRSVGLLVPCALTIYPRLSFYISNVHSLLMILLSDVPVTVHRDKFL